MTLRPRGSLALSTGVHAVLVALAAWYANGHRRPIVDNVTAIDLELLFATPPSAPTRTIELAPALTPAPAHVSTTTPVHAPSALAHQAIAREPLPESPLIEPPSHTTEAPANPFLTWGNGVEHHRAPEPAAPLLATADSDAERAALRGALREQPHGVTEHPGDPQPNTRGDRTQALEASSGYVRRAMDDAYPTQVAGSMQYYSQLRRTTQQTWNPIPVAAPSMLRTAVNTFFAPTSVSLDATRRSLGPLAEGRSANAIDDLNSAHPNSPTLQPRNTMAARAAATAQTVRVEIEVDQDAEGRITAARVTRRSGVSGFDNEAITAIRAAVARLPPHAMPGGWRSRWDFTVTVSRDPLISALPSVPGEGAAFGITAEATFDEVTGEVELHVPGRVHRSRRVRLISSHVIASHVIAR